MTATFDAFSRTGTATSPVRQMVGHLGFGRRRTSTVFSTPIEKIEWGFEYRNSNRSPATPVEQYAFMVDGVVFERFADACAKVLQLHQVRLAANEVGDAQIYVQKAHMILDGNDKFRVLSTVPEHARKARKAFAA